MQLGRIGLVRAIAGIVLGGLVAAAGCEGTDEAISEGEQAELHRGFGFHHGHRGHDAGSVGGGSAGQNGATVADGGAAADCDVCTQAQACCKAVRADQATCTFSAATCASEPGAARPAYANACLVDLMAVRGVRTGDQLPPECR